MCVYSVLYGTVPLLSEVHSRLTKPAYSFAILPWKPIGLSVLRSLIQVGVEEAEEEGDDDDDDGVRK